MLPETQRVVVFISSALNENPNLLNFIQGLLTTPTRSKLVVWVEGFSLHQAVAMQRWLSDNATTGEVSLTINVQTWVPIDETFPMARMDLIKNTHEKAEATYILTRKSDLQIEHERWKDSPNIHLVGF